MLAQIAVWLGLDVGMRGLSIAERWRSPPTGQAIILLAIAAWLAPVGLFLGSALARRWGAPR